jgi:hypothetical protein
MSDVVKSRLKDFDPSKNEKYDPGQIVIFFDNRLAKTKDDNFSTLQTYWTEGLYKLGWPSFFKPDLDPGMLRLIWYTHAGNEGSREFPLHKADAVKEMFDSLSDEGFRPMVLGWSAENPFPMIGGSEPPLEPTKPAIKVATSWSGSMIGHGNSAKDTGTPHDRVMAIISDEERREAEGRRKDVLQAENEKGGIGVDAAV